MNHKLFKFEKQRYFLLVFIVIFSFLLLNNCADKSNPTGNDNKITINVTPSSADYGLVLVNQSKKLDITIENTSSASGKVSLAITGPDKSSFNIVGSLEYTIDGKKSAVITIEFLPNAEKKYQAGLTISYNTSDAKTLNLTGEASSSIALDLNPNPMEYGKVTVGQSKTIKLAIRNVSLTEFLVTPSLTGTDSSVFSIIYQPTAALATGKIDSVVIKFTPPSVKTYKALLILDPNKKYSVQTNGEGVLLNDLDVSQSTLDFGTINIGSSKDIEFTVTNKLTTNITLSLETPAGFSITNQPAGDLLPGVPAKIAVRFSPSEQKVYAVNLIITTSSNNKYNILLKGTGDAAGNDLELSQTILDFAIVSNGTSKDIEFTVKNKLSTNITITCVATTGFTLSNQPAGDLLPGVPSKIAVRFSPTEMRTYSGNLTITTSNNNKYYVQLKGVGGTPTNLDLNSKFSATAPVIDGEEDPIWSTAQELSLVLSQVEATYSDKRNINATIKTMYDNEYIYFLVKVADDTRDDIPNKFIFKGGDAKEDKNWLLQTNGQDGISFIFPTTTNVIGDDASKTFEKFGCYTTCHTTRNYANYEGGSYPSQGTVDIWYWKAGSTNQQGYADDYFASGTDGKYPNEKRGDEPGNAYADPNYRPLGTGQILPISVPDGDNNGLDKTRFIWDGTSSPFDAAKNPITGVAWVAGDYVPGWKLNIQTNPFTERADISAKGKYVSGSWIVEFKRKLDTQNSNNADVIFKAGSSFLFSFAYFDNTRYYAEFEYLTLSSSPRPGHWGTNPAAISLNLK